MRLFQDGSGFKDKLYYFIVGHLTNMGFMLWGKGGGGSQPAPAPTSTTSYSTNVPEYAQPYVENMLNAAQAQIYNNGMSGFNPYVPYSTDPSKYIASFSPMQQQAQSGAANLSLPSNYGLATGQTLGTGIQMGGLGQQMGGMGGQYAAQATNPYAIQSYMNPYLQSSLAPQLAEARRQYGISGQQGQSQATQAGAFGGSREALMASENRRNMNTAMNQMIGQGYNNAFGQAQQAQQFGANLGLQGQQAQLGALQGQLGSANQLAGLGGQQLQAQQGIYNLQNQLGGQQQTQQQNMINQAVQNYATAQQYPFMQMGILNSMLRGLPMQQSSTQMYQAPPSTLAQLGSLGSIGLGAYGAMNPQTASTKEGGLLSIKRMAAGGNAIPMKSYSDQQLNNVVRSPVSSLMADIYARSLLKDHAYLKSNPMAANLIGQQQMPQGMPPPEMMANAAPVRTGLDNIGTGEMTQMAGGGLLAFADEGIVPTPDTTSIPRNKSGKVDLNEMYARNIIEGANMGVDKGAQKEVDALRAQITQRDKDKWNYGLMAGGFKGLQSTSPYAAVGFGTLGEGVLDYVRKEDTESAKDRSKLLEQRVEGTKADQARNIQERNSLTSAIAAEYAKEIGLAGIKSNKETENAIRQQAADDKASNDFLSKVDAEEKRIFASAKFKLYTPEYIRALAWNNTVQGTAKKTLDRLGHMPIPKDKMPLPKAIPPAEAPGFASRAADYFFGDNKTPAPAATGFPAAGIATTLNGVDYVSNGTNWVKK